jgi:hypothetical protein
MKDRSKLVTFVALIALVLAVSTFTGEAPVWDTFGDSVFWVLWAVLIFFFIRNGGCCGRRCSTSDENHEAESSPADSPAEEEKA